jgi:hypothetical protein
MVWLYNGFWLKIVAPDLHHLEIVKSLGLFCEKDARTVMELIGAGETLLGIGVVSGAFHKFVSYFQVGVIVLMNMVGIVFGGAAIPHPIGLLIMNAPTVMCALLVGLYGPGGHALSFKKPGSKS